MPSETPDENPFDKSPSDASKEMLGPTSEGAPGSAAEKLRKSMKDNNDKLDDLNKTLGKLPDRFKEAMDSAAKRDHKFMEDLYKNKDKKSSKGSASSVTVLRQIESHLAQLSRGRKGMGVSGVNNVQAPKRARMFQEAGVITQQAQELLKVRSSLSKLTEEEKGALETMESVYKAMGTEEKKRMGKYAPYVQKLIEGKDLSEKELENVKKYIGLARDVSDQHGLDATISTQIRKIWLEIAGTQLTASEQQKGIAKGLVGYLKAAGKGVTALVGWDDVGSGIVKNHIEMTNQMRMYSFATGQSSKGLLELTHQSGVAAETGGRLVEYQKALYKTMKMGYKDEVKASKISKTGLNLAKQTGMNAESTSEHLSKISQQMNLSNIQASTFARQVKFASQATGVYGENLESAVKSAEDLQHRMRNIGQLTGASAGNLVQLTASLEKFGVSQEASGLMQALSGGSAFTGAGGQNIALASRLGGLSGVGMGDIRSGKALNDKSQRGSLGMAAQKMLSDQIATLGYAGTALEDLPGDIKYILSNQMQSGFGIEPGALEQLGKALEESGKTYVMQLGDIETALSKNIGAEERRSLLMKKNNIELSASMDALGGMEKALKNGVDVNKAFSDSLSKNKEASDVLGSQNADETARAAVASVNDQLKLAGKEDSSLNANDIARRVSGGGSGALTALEELDKAQKIAATALRAQEDPLEDARQTLHEINEYLQNGIGGWASKFLDGIGGKGILVLSIIAALAPLGLLRGIGGMLSTINSLAKDQFAKLNDTGDKNMKAMVDLEKRASHEGSVYVADSETHTLLGDAAQEKSSVQKAAEGSPVTELTLDSMLKTNYKDIISKARAGGGPGGMGALDANKHNVKAGVDALSRGKFHGVGKIARGVKGSFAAGGLKGGIGAVGGGLKALSGVGLKGIGTGLMAVAKGGAALAGKIPIIGWVLTLLMGLPKAFEAFGRAAEIFGETAEDVSIGQKLAAGTAGLLIGALDSLTFGILGSLLGPEGLKGLEDGFAKLLFWFTPVFVVFDILGAVLKGVWEAVKELWGALKEGFNEVFTPIMEIWDSIAESLGISTDAGFKWTDVLKIITSVIKNLITLGPVMKIMFKIIGYVIGGIAALVGGLFKLGGAIVGFIKSIFDSLPSWLKDWIGLTEKETAKEAEKSVEQGEGHDAIKKVIAAEQQRMGVSEASVSALNEGKYVGARGSGISGMGKAGVTHGGKGVSVRALEASGMSDADKVRAFEAETSRGVVTSERTQVEGMSPVGVGDDMHKRIRREMAGSTPDAGNSQLVEQNSELKSEMAKNTRANERQIDILNKILEALNTTDSGTIEAGSTKPKLTHRVPAQYYTWQTRYSDNAQSNVSMPT